jgi:hypothetical protein
LAVSRRKCYFSSNKTWVTKQHTSSSSLASVANRLQKYYWLNIHLSQLWEKLIYFLRLTMNDEIELLIDVTSHADYSLYYLFICGENRVNIIFILFFCSNWVKATFAKLITWWDFCFNLKSPKRVYIVQSLLACLVNFFFRMC